MNRFDELINFGQFQKVIDSAIAEIQEQKLVARIWDHDHTVWKQDPTEISNRLGWLHSAEAMSEHLTTLEAMVEEVVASEYTHALLLGMGGSSLAPEVFRKTFDVKTGHPELAVLDSTDPGAVVSCADRLDLSRTLFIVSTKSGGTVETLSLFKYFYNQLANHTGQDKAGEHFMAITDAGSPLEKLATEYNFRSTWLNDPHIGGRYSALSYFGLVPAALIGVDVKILLHRAMEMMEACKSDITDTGGGNYGAQLGLILGELAETGRDKVTFIIAQGMDSFGDWVEQLIAESTGKQGKGILPVVHESLGPPEVYGEDRLFIHLQLEGDGTQDASINALEDAGHPLIRFHLRDLYDLGSQFFLWEMATAFAGARMGINPFDQPNVESAKVLAREMVAAYTKNGTLPRGESSPPDTEVFHSFLAQAKPGDYIALQAYIQPTVETYIYLQKMRHRLRNSTRLATTVGFGPRFLHSTGQLHKGDAGHGLFIQLTADDPQDAPIPDRAGSADSSITFGVLKAAQALGDRQALVDGGRRVITFHLGADVADGLEYLIDALK